MFRGLDCLRGVPILHNVLVMRSNSFSMNAVIIQNERLTTRTRLLAGRRAIGKLALAPWPNRSNVVNLWPKKMKHLGERLRT